MILYLPSTHDYDYYYISGWEEIKSGGNPWLLFSNFSYGPTFSIFYPIYLISPKLTHILYLFCYLFCANTILRDVDFNTIKKKLLYYFLLLNPLFWVFVVRYGNNDAFLSFTIIYGIYLFNKKKYFLSSLLLSFGAGLKYSPLFLIPNIGIQKNKINTYFIITTVVLIVSLFGIGYLFFDESIFNSLIWGNSRNSKNFSIFRFFDSSKSPLTLIGINKIGDWNTPILILGILTSIYFNYKYKTGILLSCFFNFSTIILLYKVVNHQYYITLLFLMTWVYLKHFQFIKKEKYLMIAYILFWAYISTFCISHYFVFLDLLKYPKGTKSLMSLPAFSIQLFIHLKLFKLSIKNYNPKTVVV